MLTALLSGTLLLGAPGLGGCAHATTPAPTPAPKVVLDYRNGWYHKASGAESIVQVAGHYKREAKLVAELNHTASPSFVPSAGTMLYIPPTDNRTQVRELLTRLQGHPELIPKKPWDPSLVSSAKTKTVASKTAQPKISSKTTKKPAAATADLDPPPPAAEKVVAEARAASDSKKPGFWGRMFGGSNANAATPPPQLSVPQRINPATTKPATGPAANDFIWPVKGEVITRYKSGWHEACHGIEIAANEGTPVRAARAGRVLIAQIVDGYGNLVLIDHGDGFATTYGFNQTLAVRVGQTVQRGQTIATVGRPSQGSSSKLFFQVRRNSLPMDPLSILKDS